MESTLQSFRCDFCGEPHLNGNCVTYSYCDICGKDLVYCECEPEWTTVMGNFHWLADIKLLGLHIDQPHNLPCDFCGGYHLDGNCKEFYFTTIVQQEHASTIEESLENKKDEEEKKIEREDHIVWKEAQNSLCREGVKIQQEITQPIIFSTRLWSNKEDGSEDLDRYLDSFYALFVILHLERVWKHLQLYFKFMKFLPHKQKKKDDVFFVSYIPP